MPVRQSTPRVKSLNVLLAIENVQISSIEEVLMIFGMTKSFFNMNSVDTHICPDGSSVS